MKQILIFIIPIILFSCRIEKKKRIDSNVLKNETSISNEQNAKNKIEIIDTIGYEMVSGDKIKLLKQLDSLARSKWTDNYMPQGLIPLSLYSAYQLYETEINKNIKIKAIITYADDWTRMHLITCSLDSNLIDYKEIGENMSYLMEQTDSFEMYMDNDAKLIVLNDSTYKIEQIETTTKDFYDESVKDTVMTFKTDSIFFVDRDGRINNRL